MHKTAQCCRVTSGTTITTCSADAPRFGVVGVSPHTPNTNTNGNQPNTKRTVERTLHRSRLLELSQVGHVAVNRFFRPSEIFWKHLPKYFLQLEKRAARALRDLLTAPVQPWHYPICRRPVCPGTMQDTHKVPRGTKLRRRETENEDDDEPNGNKNVQNLQMRLPAHIPIEIPRNLQALRTRQICASHVGRRVGPD